MNIKIASFKKYFFLLLFLAFNLATVTAADKCIVHLDKSFYVTGEVIWYKVYLTPDFKDKPVAIRATLLDASGTIQHSSFIKTEGKTFVHGYYKIPFNNKSGMYLLRFSAINKAKKQPVTLVESQIPVYNDLEGVAKLAKNEEGNSANGSATLPMNNELDISIQLPKNVYGKRQQVQPTIIVKDKNGNTVAGNISVSVVDYDLVGDDIQMSKNVRGGKTLDGRQVTIFSNDIYLKGVVSKSDGNPHKANVLGAYDRVQDKMLYTKSNESGEFFLSVSEFHGNQSFQFLGQQTEYETIQIKEDKQLAINDYQALPYTDQVTDYLVASRQRKKIFQHYSSLEANLVTQEYRVTKKELKPDAAFITKEYEDFEFMSIFFKENLTPLRFEFQNDSTYLAKMYNPKNQSAYDKFFRGKPLILVDGIATRNGDFMARMRMTDVEKVELFYDLKKLNRQYKLFGSNGVTKITTYDKIESLPVFEANNVITINGLQKAATYPAFDPAQINNNKLQPFFRPQLFWNGDLVVKKDGKATISYFQTDDRSTFQIRVVAQSADGKIGYKELNYEVK